jgi:hypothetical protein
MHVDLPTYLRQKGVMPQTLIPCPECKNGFAVGEGYVGETIYTRKDTGEQELGFMVFCNPTCFLLWFTPTQLGGLQ